jgi:hypothetical protein
VKDHPFEDDSREGARVPQLGVDVDRTSLEAQHWHNQFVGLRTMGRRKELGDVGLDVQELGWRRRRYVPLTLPSAGIAQAPLRRGI